jgi:hypothetical protein
MKPDCYKCQHRRNLPGDCHSSCVNRAAKVEAYSHGIRMGWFVWPFNFDPVWLVSCDGFAEKAETLTPKVNETERKP